MTYQHSFRKIYGFLFLLSSIITIITLYITVNVKGGLPISTYYEDSNVWFSRVVIMPVINIVFSPLIGALVIQWVYKSKIASGVIYCRNTLGVSIEVRISEIKSIQFYNIPIIPIAKIKMASNYWSGWVSMDAAKCITVT
jgi:hypothetical protein